MLLRYTKEKENLDFLFSSVFFLGRFVMNFKNCRVYRASESEIKEFEQSIYYGNLLSDQSLFIILSDYGKTWIGALGCKYQKNKLLPMETSIPIKNETPLSEGDILAIVETYRTTNELPKVEDNWITFV